MQTLDEIWKDVAECNNYEVSSIGQVRRKGYFHQLGHSVFYCQAHLLRLHDNTHGYLQASLSINGHVVKRKIHRLVALAFLDNPDNKYAVNHKNGNKIDNRVENLEWCTKSENETHAYKFLGKKSPSCRIKYGASAKSKPVIQLSLSGEVIKVWSCAREAAEIGGFCFKAISGNCRGKTHSHKGYCWKFENALKPALL